MADTTTPTTPVIPAAQDLQINLEEAPKMEEITLPENKGPELNLDLDLNLSDAPKDDDRLKTEDQKNNEVVATPVVEVTPVEVAPVEVAPVEVAPVEVAPVETVAEVQATMPIINEPTLLETTPEVVAEITPVVEVVPVEVTPVTIAVEAPMQVPVETKAEEIVIPEPVAEIEPVAEVITPSTTIETIPASSEIIGGNPPEGSSLTEDMKMINELEGHPSAGGLAPEAVVIPQPTPNEAPKTFDLDAMLGGPAIPPVVEATQAPIVQADTPMPQVMPQASATPMQAPAFTIPTTQQVPVQAVMQTSVPQNKNKGVKALLFTVMFAALGFTTFFILKTMYPIEFGSMFGGSTIQTHAIDNTTGVVEESTGTVQDLSGTTETGTVQDLSGTIETGTGTHESAPVDNTFGGLNDLGTDTTTQPEQNDVSRLTDYVTQGNDFLTQGKTVGNNTMIKYGLYISKKATTFLEKIANGEQINNLSGYFAQFDQYIVQLKELAGQTPNPTAIPDVVPPQVSTTPLTNGIQGMTDTPTSIDSFTAQ